MKTIKHKGKEMTTAYYKEISDKEYEELKVEYYKKPDVELVDKEINNIFSKNGKMVTNINKTYFRKLQAKVVMHHSKWSIEEFLQSKDLCCHAFGRIENNDKVYPKNYKKIKNFETYLRLGAKGATGNPSNFQLKTVDYILQNYNVNNNYYDFSCGWGVRMLGAMRNGVNYYGTDPNYLLTDELNKLNSKIRNIIPVKSETHIYTQGSEKYIPELENKIGIAFSSPPYFMLEDYKIGEQSCNTETSYDSWKTDFLSPTFENIHNYLVEDGYLMVNINNYKKYDLVGDAIKIAALCGFDLVDKITMNNIQRINCKRQLNDNSEKILVFKRV